MAGFGGILAVGLLFISGYVHPSVEASGRLDVFHEALEKLSVTGDSLPFPKVEEYYDAVLHRFSCAVNGTALPNVSTELNNCTEKLCLDIDKLFTIVGGNKTAGLAEDEFENAAMVALYILSRGSHPCNSVLAPVETTVDEVQRNFISVVQKSGDTHITDDDLETFLHRMEELYTGEDHGHEGEEEDGHDDHEERRRKKREVSDDDHDDDDMMPAVVEHQCLAPDAVLYYLDADEDEQVEDSHFVQLTSIIVHLMFEGSPIEEECRLLPKKSFFVKKLISNVMEGNVNMTRAGLEMLMEKLGIVAHSENAVDDHGHEHKRKRRSVDNDDVILSRAKRQATTTATKCYSPAELTAVFDTGDVITADQMTQISPALVLQKAYADCTAAADPAVNPHGPTTAEKWGYSFVAILLICLCALAGVVIAPCMNRVAYKVFMALFVGLAIGTLTGDAMLHLIPMTMGAHAHEEDDGHAHGTEEIIIEQYIWFALITIAGLYMFYLLETFFGRWIHKKAAHGHSHSFEMTVDGKKSKESLSSSSAEPEKKGNLSLSVMIILGDAVHNFADGLAVGAAFSSSVNVGIATAIAVFCHELPHELGDFAVLLQNGMSVKKAMFWNGFSALTAFLGLIVSLLVATDDDVRKWIFAITAGMFLYIALTDLLPQLTSGEAATNNLVLVMHNLGMLLGIAIMLLIAIFEERITIG